MKNTEDLSGVVGEIIGSKAKMDALLKDHEYRIKSLAEDIARACSKAWVEYQTRHTSDHEWCSSLNEIKIKVESDGIEIQYWSRTYDRREPSLLKILKLDKDADISARVTSQKYIDKIVAGYRQRKIDELTHQRNDKHNQIESICKDIATLTAQIELISQVKPPNH